MPSPEFRRLTPQAELLTDERSTTPAGWCALLLMEATERLLLGSDVANFRRVTTFGGSYYEGYDADKDKAECFRNGFREIGAEFLAFEGEGGDLADAAAFLDRLGRTIYSACRSGGFARVWHGKLVELVKDDVDPRTITAADLAERVWREER